MSTQMSTPEGDHPASRAVGMVVDVDDGEGGKTRALGSPINFRGHVGTAALSAAPHIGEHRREVLGDFGFTTDEVSELIDRSVVHQA